ncbi:hypothetical protein [Kibdelosporangium aridum]|uniref:hypothetical protein n=1 Tax=Kibdelosporangium aridum TaxID=2030 RepID=UPI000525FA59
MGRLLLVLVLVAGLGAAGLALGGVFDEPPDAFCPDSRDNAEVKASSLLDGEVAPMSATGPRPTKVFDVYDRDSRVDGADPNPPEDGKMYDVTYELEQKAWQAKNQVQVVVCQYRHGIGEGEGKQCTGYNNQQTIPVLAATYTYKVYEAATKTLLTTFTVPGSLEDTLCPRVITYEAGDQPHLAASPDHAELANRLRPYVEPAQ